MKLSRQPAALASLALLVLLTLSLSCGGGGGGSSGPPPPPPISLQFVTVNLPDGFASKPYSFPLLASGGTPPYTWSLASGSAPLPQGLTFSFSGQLSGSPADPPATPFDSRLMIQVADSASRSITGIFNLRVFGLLRIANTSLPSGNVGVAYYQSLAANGGLPPYTFSVVLGSPALPAGLTLAPTGSISGTTSVPGRFDIIVQLQDSAPSSQTVTGTVNLTVRNDLVITTASLPLGVIGQPYREFVIALGGIPPYTFSAPFGSPFPGLTLLASGELSGTPSMALNSICNVRVTDSALPQATVQSYFWLNIRPILSISSTTLRDAIRTRFYSSSIDVDGGRPPLTLRITTGSLPVGLSLDNIPVNTGRFDIEGTPSTLGISNFTVEASDSSTPPGVVTQPFALRIVEPLSMTPPPLPNTIAGTPFTATFAATGGVPPYNWSANSLPSGMAMDRDTGVLSGTPTVSNDYYIGVNIWDQTSPSQQIYTSFLLKIIGPLLISTSSLPSVMVGVPVQINISAVGGIGPYAWTSVSGSLSAGLTFDTSTGRISGTPTAAESKSITMRVDNAGPPAQNHTRTLTLSSSNALGRNDSIANATPLSNGTYLASISPADDASGTLNPDSDYYVLTANPGALVRLDTTADRLAPASPMDSVIEIVDANGNRLQTCDGSALGNYTNPCMNDDSYGGGTLDSRLFFLVSGAPGDPPVTFYVRVLDWSGMARPDFLYTITITGAN